MAWAPCAATGQGQVVGAAAAGGKLCGLSPVSGWHRADVWFKQGKQREVPMRHTEVKMDRGQNTTPREFNHRGRQSVFLPGCELFEDARFSLQASAFSYLQAQVFIFHLTGFVSSCRTPLTGSSNPRRVASTGLAHTLENSTTLVPRATAWPPA